MPGARPLLRFLRRRHGQSTVEYVATLSVVLVLMLAVGQLDADERLVASLGGAICEAVLAAPCAGSADDIAAAELAALPACPVRGATSKEAISVTALATAGGRDEALLEEASDGTTAVTFIDAGSVGAEAGVGASFGVKGSSEPAAAGVRAEAGVALEVGGGKSYRFPTPERAAAFLERFGPEESTGGELRSRVLATCVACHLAGVRPVELPAPDATFVEGGGSARAVGEVEAGRGGAGLEGLVRNAIGRKVDHSTGRVTYYLRLEGEGAATAGALLGVVDLEAAGAASLDGAIELLVSPRGRPLELTARSALAGSRSADAAVTAGGFPATGFSGFRSEGWRGSGWSGVGGGRMLELEGTVDLRGDVLSREAALRLVEALKPPTDPVELVQAADAVRDRISAVGEIDVRSYATGDEDRGVEASGAFGGRVGAGFEHATTTRLLLGAYTRPAGADAFVLRSDCADPPT